MKKFITFGLAALMVALGSVSVSADNYDCSEQGHVYGDCIAETKLKFALAYTVTEEDVKVLYSLVEGITTAYMDDPAAMNIILEDANDYFIGRKSLDEVVKLIKNRVGILVSE